MRHAVFRWFLAAWLCSLPRVARSVPIDDYRLSVRLYADVNNELAQAILHDTLPVDVLLAHAGRNVWRALYENEVDVQNAIAALQTLPQVRWVEADPFIECVLAENTPTVVRNDLGVAAAWHLALMGLPDAWSFGLGDAAVNIAIVDTGIDMQHPEFVDRLVWPRDTLDADDDPTPQDGDNHGTESAGVAAAAGYNSVGVIGICPLCSVMPIRIMEMSGRTRSSALSDALYWAADHNAQVISNSWRPPTDAPLTQDFLDALDYVLYEAPGAESRVVLFAAGNEGRALDDDALYQMEGVWTISALERDNLISSYANWGEGIDFVAPAASWTTSFYSKTVDPMDGYTSQFGGTSAACAAAAGAVALVASANPNLSRDQLQDVFASTALPIETVSAQHQGAGRLQVDAAIRLAEQMRASVSVTTSEIDPRTSQPSRQTCQNFPPDFGMYVFAWVIVAAFFRRKNCHTTVTQGSARK